MQDPKETINIENVVASTGIGQELDLQSVAMDLEGADYDPSRSMATLWRSSSCPIPVEATTFSILIVSLGSCMTRLKTRI